MKNKVGTALYLSALSLMGSGASSLAADWDINPFIEVRETYSDNINLDEVVAQSDFVTQTTIGANIVTAGPRFSLNLNYGLTYLYYPSIQGDKDEFRHSLLADTQSELVRDFLYFDAEASVTQQFIDRRAAFTNVDALRSENRSTVSIINASPYTQNKVGGNFAILTNRYTYSYIHSKANSNFNPTNIGDLTTHFHEGLIALSNGSKFTKFTWSFENYYRKIVTTSGRDNNIYSTTFNGDYQINRQVAIVGLVGYSDRNATTGPANYAGFIWRLGGRLTPGPRTVLEGTYGKEFIGYTFDFRGSYRVTPNINAVARYYDRYQTFSEFVLDDFQNGVNNGVGIQQDVLGDEFVRTKEYNIAVEGVRGRSTIAIAAFRRKSTSENVNTSFVRDSIGIVWTRQLNTRLTFIATADVMRDDFVTDPEPDVFVSYSARFDYGLSENVIASLDYAHTRRRQLLYNYVSRSSNLISLSIRVEL